MNKIFLSIALLCSFSHASVVKQTQREWRPKHVVSLPRESYVFMGSNIPDKDKASLWKAMGSFVVHPKKNKWSGVKPECTDELTRSMDDKRKEAFIEASGKFFVTKLSDGNYFVRSHIAGPGGAHGWMSKGSYWLVKAGAWVGMAAAAIKIGRDIRTDDEVSRLIVDQSTAFVVKTFIPGGDLVYNFVTINALQVVSDTMPSETPALFIVGAGVVGQMATVAEPVNELVEVAARSVETLVAMIPWTW